jgi:pentalenene oxygenase
MTSNIVEPNSAERNFTFGVAPNARPLVGHALSLARNRLRFAESLAASGDLVEIRLGRRPAYVICHPELARQVLLDDKTFDKGGMMYDKIRGVLGNGLATCPHDDHRRQRRLLQPAFRNTCMPRYGSVMADRIGVVVDSWHDGRELDVLAEMQVITTDVSCRSMFAANLDRNTIARLHDDLGTILNGVHRRLILPDWLPTPGGRRFDRARADLRAILAAVGDEYRRDGVDRDDLLSILLFSGETSSDVEVYDQVVTFFIGADVTACAIAWALYLVSTHPQVEKRLHAEVDSVLAGRPVQWDDYENLQFTRRIVAEALRLCPPVWLTSRRTAVDTNLAGRHIPAGTTIIYSSYIIHQRADLYPDPTRFDPDREPGLREEYLPFGSGPRKCIGQHFGTAEATLTLASIASRWLLRTSGKARIRPAAQAMLVPDHLHMRITARG